jgi:hypothetical protein
MISTHGRAQFGNLFGVDLTQSDGNAFSKTRINTFREQALWGEPGTNFGISACSNHIEGIDGD